MCGSFKLDFDVMKLLKRYNVEKNQIDNEKFSGDFYPGMNAPIIRQGKRFRMLSDLKWFYPLYGSEKNIFNARSETINQKALFADSFKYRRGLLPVASFYEWSKNPTRKFEIKDNDLMSLAVIFNRFEIKNEQPVEGFSIVTTKSYGCCKYIHHRLPVIIPREYEDIWLDRNSDLNSLLDIMNIQNEKLSVDEIGELK